MTDGDDAQPPGAQPDDAQSDDARSDEARADEARAADAARATLSLPPPKYLRWEIIAVFAISLGASGVNALLSLIGSLLARQSLSSQHALLVGSQSPNHWFDLVLQLVGIAEALTPVLLVLYLMARSGEPPSVLGLDASQPGRDLARGAVVAAIIGGAGLGLYIAAFNLGLSLNVVPESLPNVWWRIPVLLLSAAHDGILEEILVIGYLLRRLGQLGWTPWRAIVAAAILRGSYHLYQGFGAFLGNFVMGIIFGALYRRWGRVTPLIIAHALIDAVTFVGYAALVGKVSWLP
ncbi:MAG TPA: CPBP family intramembrane glutamic endopeptidase [Streptosporangiaceae bacterium]|nr:CPBP family intramembrane glutamic endopeptidase [Streptosporangiaceae bacterium]